MRILLIGFSKTGNVFSFMDYLSEKYPQLETYKYGYNNNDLLDVKDYDLIIVGSSTWGDGVIPKNCKQFIIDNALKYNKKWIVFGSGNTLFVHYCKAVDSIVKILTETQNEVLATFKYEQRFDTKKLDDVELEQVRHIETLIKGDNLND